MDPLTMAAIMAALGLTKHIAVDQPMAERQRKEQAAKTRYSPWTGLTGADVAEPNAVGTMMQFGMSGAQLGQAMQDHKLNQALTKSVIDKNTALTSSISPAPSPSASAPSVGSYAPIGRMPAPSGYSDPNLRYKLLNHSFYDELSS